MAQDFESPLGPPSLERNKQLSECLAGFARQYENFAAICQPDIRDMMQHKAHGLAKAAEAFEYAEVPIESGKHAAKMLPGIGKVTGETVQEMLVRGGSTTKFRKEFMPEWLVKRTEAAAKEAKAAKAAAKRAEKAAAGGSSGAAKKRKARAKAEDSEAEEEEAGGEDSDVIAVDDEDGEGRGAGVGSKRAASTRAKRPAAKRARRSDDDEEDEDASADDDNDEEEEEDDEEAEYKPRKSRSRGGAGSAAAAGEKKPAAAAAKGRGKAAPAAAAAVASGSTESTAIDVVGSSDEEEEEGASSARAAGKAATKAGAAGKAKAAAAPRKRAAAASKSAAAAASDEDDDDDDEGAKAAKPAPRKRAPAKPKAAKAEKPFKVPKSAKGPEWMAKIWDHASPEEQAAASLERNARIASLIQALAKATQTAAAGLPREQATSAWYKITAFEKAAKTIADCTSPLLSGEHARCLPGVGEGVSAIVQQIIETGKLEGVEEEAPGQTGVAALVRVPGISQTLAGRLVRDEKINAPADLQAAVRNGATFDLPPDALVAARFAAELLLPLPRTEAADLLGRVLTAAAGSGGSAASAAAADGGVTVVAGGGYIRGESPLQALDLLVTSPAFKVPHPETFGLLGHPAAQAAPAAAVGGAGGASSGPSAEEAAAVGASLLAQLVAALQAAGIVVETVPQTHALAADLIVRLPEPGAAAAAAGAGGGSAAAGAAAASALPPAEEANPFADFELPPAEDAGDDDGGYGGSAASTSAAKGAAAAGGAGGSGAGSLLSHEEMRLMRAGAAAARSASSTGGDNGRAATGTGGPSEQAAADAGADDEAREAAGLQPGQHAARFLRLLAVPYNCLGPAFLRSSSSEPFWTSLQAHATRRGLRLSEFALQPFVAHAIEEAAAAPSRGTKGMAFAGAKKKKAAAAAASAAAGPAAAGAASADVKPSAAELASAEAGSDVKPTAAELAATEAGAAGAPAAAAAASTFREYGPALALEGGDEAVFAALQLDYVPPEQRILALGGAEAAPGATGGDATASSSSASLASAEVL